MIVLHIREQLKTGPVGPVRFDADGDSCSCVADDEIGLATQSDVNNELRTVAFKAQGTFRVLGVMEFCHHALQQGLHYAQLQRSNSETESAHVWLSCGQARSKAKTTHRALRRLQASIAKWLALP
jgi:hypothetical protein